ncbi:S-layer homology domain-containing protein [Lachnospiraceae bacterium NSJ-143]|nr:S-layer homology domain-containing protein [Lachnospiraceae bacterium NSJ-143]
MKSLKKKLVCIASALAMCLSVSGYAMADDIATVNASSGEGGTISPNNNVEIPDGEDVTFIITPDEGYVIDEVIVDNKSVDDVEKYTFYNITGDHLIRATFKTKTKAYKDTGNGGYTKVVGSREEKPEEDTSAWTTDPSVIEKRKEENKDKVFFIKTDYGHGGTISPNNTVQANGGESVTFEFKPNSGYVVKGVYIDDVYGGKPGSYTFKDLSKDHTIRVEFETESQAALSERNSGVSTNKSTSGTRLADVKFNVDSVENPFSDIKSSDSYYKSVLNVYDNDVLLGTAANRFSPDELLTREAAARAFYRIERIVSAKFSNPYSDVSESSQYRDAIAWSYHNGIIPEESKGVFNPQGSVTKEELCTMIYNYAKYTGAGPKGNWLIKLDYYDADQISPENAEGVMYCAVKGIAGTTSTGTFSPKSELTRAEAAEILNRAMIITRQDSGKKQ